MPEINDSKLAQLAQKDRPLLFSAPMVQALRADRKTVTRRTRGLDKINAEPDAWVTVSNEFDRPGMVHFRYMMDHRDDMWARCPYGVAGDRLWTREAWRTTMASNDTKPSLLPIGSPIYFEADCVDRDQKHSFIGKLRPGMFMPRWASRDTLEVVSARPERLHAITEADAIAEGLFGKPYPAQYGMAAGSVYFWGTPPNHGGGFDTAVQCYACLWDAINGAGSWAKNPWVWRVEFRRVAQVVPDAR